MELRIIAILIGFALLVVVVQCTFTHAPGSFTVLKGGVYEDVR